MTLALNLDINHPRNVPQVKVDVLSRTTVPALCRAALIRCRVTADSWRKVVLHAGRDHFRTDRTDYVGIGRFSSQSGRVQALRALEILAHGFFDYAARECVCGRGLFVASAVRGRPPIGSRAMTAKERMRKMRSRA